jgi:hypothetical protein
MRPPSLLPLPKTTSAANGYRGYDIGEGGGKWQEAETRKAPGLAPEKPMLHRNTNRTLLI